MSLKRTFSLTLSVLAIFALAAAPLIAAPKSKPAGPRPTTHGKATTTRGKPTTTRGQATTVHGRSTTLHGKASSSKGQSARAQKPTSSKPTTRGSSATKPAKAPKGGSTTTTQTSARANGKGNTKKSGTVTAGNTAASTTPANAGSTATTGTTTTSTPTTWTPTNAVSEKLVTKRNQLNRALAVLPPGTDLNLATAGFRNFGQFNAAVNVSQNLGIAFADLKAAMTGRTLAGLPTNQPVLSLGQAIQKYKPGVNGDVAAQTAMAQANAETTTVMQPRHGKSR